jgi:hypothetical protein
LKAFCSSEKNKQHLFVKSSKIGFMEKRPNLKKTQLKLIWEAPKIKLLDEKAEAELKAILEPFKQALKEKRRKQKEAEIFAQLSDLPPAA